VSSETWWNLATTGKEEAQGKLVHVGMAYNKLFADKDEYELVKGWYERRASLESSILRRQVEILYKTFASGQGDEGALRHIKELDAEANAIYSNHRGAVGDSLLGLRLPRMLYLRRRRAANLPDLCSPAS
jgi:peptidyl-dipeptidase A